VAEIPHYVVKAGAEKTSFIHRGNGIKPAAFTPTESGWEHGTEARECGLVAGALTGRNQQIGVLLPLLDISGDGLLQFIRLLPPERGAAGHYEALRRRFAINAQR